MRLSQQGTGYLAHKRLVRIGDHSDVRYYEKDASSKIAFRLLP